MTLDGYIASPDGDISFLSIAEASNEDYGYLSFTREIDTVIWGRKTYDKVLSFDVEFPHKGKRCIVLSRTKSGSDGNVEFYNGDIPSLIHTLRSQDGANIYCDGGAEIVTELLKHNLIDRLIISVIPHLLGSGIRLFQDGRPSQNLILRQTNSYPSGVVQLWYDCRKETIS